MERGTLVSGRKTCLALSVRERAALGLMGRGTGLVMGPLIRTAILYYFRFGQWTGQGWEERQEALDRAERVERRRWKKGRV